MAITTLQWSVLFFFFLSICSKKEKRNISFHERLASAQTHVCKHALNVARLPVWVSVHAWLLNSLPEGSSAPLERLCQVFGKEKGGPVFFTLSLQRQRGGIVTGPNCREENAASKIEHCVTTLVTRGVKSAYILYSYKSTDSTLYNKVKKDFFCH